MIRAPKVTALLASVALVGSLSPAFALDGQDLLNKINAIYGPDGGTVKAQSVEVDGSNVVLKGVSITPVGPDAKPLDIGELTLQDVTEEDGGAYHIGLLEFPDIDMTQDKASIKVSDLYLSGIWIPGDVTTGDINSLPIYEEAHSGPISISVDGKEVFSMQEATGTMETSEDETTLSFAGDITGIKADLSTVEDAKAKETIQALGLESIDGNVTMAGSWEVPTGTIEVEEYAFEFANIGTLNLAFSLSGYTMDLIKQLQETSRQMQSQPGNEQAQQAAGLAMLGLMQQMSFNSAEISFDDDGITKRGLDFAGKQQGTSGEQMAQMVKAMVPVLLGQFKLAELQATVPAAVNTYVDDPQNLTISLAPEKPVPFPMIMGAGMGAPETLPKLLGVTVTANEE
ncbi:hypothetical protein J5J10_10410 [Ciceribacter sp. L1K23]|uniref:hypothetical protein n=1 Tax=Ciceribacter sp. L1K23 TaxID=2820276 RepID=UPI001B830082|nr:hypothetical protein [Ciceribacter sp. L1K23]MBR0556088.1 hypothetical protein [Ciceribacter sp. L1K23]